MGRPNLYDSQRSKHDRGEASSAMSLHSNIGNDAPHYNDEEEDHHDEALPPYTDDPAGAEEDAALLPGASSSSATPYDLPPPVTDKTINQSTNVDRKGTTLTRLSPVLTTDPIALKSYIIAQSKEELQSQIVVYGSHQETSRDNKNKETKKTVYDFGFSIDVTPTISRRRQVGDCWSRLTTAGNEKKIFRGGRMKSVDKKFKADVGAYHETNSLDTWCHLFCASSSKLKTFTIRRVITGRDEKALRDGIEMAVRSTRYRGRLEISFPTHTRSVTVMSPHWMNRARANVYVWWVFVILQWWVFAWPVLWFMTRRWDVVAVEFPFKREDKRTGADEYCLCSEEDWVRKWGYTIQQAAVRKAGSNGTGRVANVSYIDENEDREERERRARMVNQQMPQGGVFGAALGVLRSGVAIANEYQAGRDWGYDE